MKISYFTILIAGIFIFFSATSCDSSKKGAWSESVKSEFLTACQKGFEGQSAISEEQGKKICDCGLKKLEANYAPTDVPEEEATKVGSDCAKEIMLEGK